MAFPKWWSDPKLRKEALELKVGLRKRPSDVPHILPGSEVAIELDKFQKWVLWRSEGAHKPRPLSLVHWKPKPEYWDVLSAYMKHTPSPPDKPQPEHLGDPLSWTLPGPLVESGVVGDDGGMGGLMKEGTIGLILIPGVCPLWECHQVNGPGHGLLAQIEGGDQLQVAHDLIQQHRRPGDHLAVVGTGNVPAQKMLDIGVNVCFIELNAQAAWEPYGNAERMEFQAHQDGWPYVKPNYGVYSPIGLKDYRDYVPLVWSSAKSEFVRGTQPQGIVKDCGVFSAQGSGDTNSWPTILAL